MKQMRVVWLLALVSLLCIGCSDAKKPAADTPAPTATPVSIEVSAPSPTAEPEGDVGVVRADDVGVLLTRLSRGYAASVIGEKDKYYRVSVDGTEAFVEKRFLRLSSEAAYKSWKGYAKSKTEVYETAYLVGELIAVLANNTAVTVEDAAGDALLISWEDQQGYTNVSNISKTQPSSDGGSDDNGANEADGVDGGDISLSQKPSRETLTVRLSIHRKEKLLPAPAPVFPCEGTVIADATEAYVAVCNLGETVRVISADETSCEVLTENGVGTIPRRLVLLLTETPYREWTGYAVKDTPFFTDYRMSVGGKALSLNTEVRILDDLEDCYLVMADEQKGYVQKKYINDEQFEANSGDGSEIEWTEPVL